MMAMGILLFLSGLVLAIAGIRGTHLPVLNVFTQKGTPGG